MRRRKSVIFFLVLGISLSILAVALNVGWILLNLREVVLLVLGIIFFALIITGLILNTIFLVREIKRNEQHDAFLNAVTHELKTPIASIKLYLDTLRNRNVSEEKRLEFYDVMQADSDRLLKTVEQVLQAGQMREKRREANVMELDIAQVIENCATMIRTRYNLAPDVIKSFFPDEKLMVLGDERDLESAFMNLLDNAVKYSGDEPRISIRVRKTGLGNRLAIRIRDNGIGISGSELKRIFKRFYRSPEAPATGAKGTGLGLFIVKGIIERHGGTVSADSKGTGRGSTFLIELPLV
ncbi:MAG: HAMP domain-containing histidine kinase [Acidobacteria bacterium]|nr:HAMP domain-containing histidine kinase [Acidobacteriota bacterium]